MIKHIWSILCQNSVINKDDNNISLQNVLEQLAVSMKTKEPAEPEKSITLPINYEVVSLWKKEDDKEGLIAKVELTILSPNNEELNKIEQDLIFNRFERMRSRFKIFGLKLSGSGIYNFRISIKEEGQKLFKITAEIPLEVKIETDKS